ncbi:hybrid sensor histidine kinase/response regulator transcription factor [Flavobacterium agrisoli]|uniref:histidine kinase n=1 Tax=Flavobacterium agrisoli TaxID=2793066 RepID=A0A934PNN0_9FLAO|nr:hybrid sensor histidine kinase/response regulator transcription factor [Flavobacterium agrisoli]MBK0370205.1 response regulator [Flavobacterium agrisoli]
MKKVISKIFLSFVFLLLYLQKNYSQIQYKLENYSTENGLSHDGVRDILKGKEGFMWFATWDGINRFDGENFISYKATAGDNSSLGNNRIDLMKEDYWGHIWFKAYDGQIYRFDKNTEKFISIATLIGSHKNEFENIIPLKNGNVCLTTAQKGLYLAIQNNNQIEVIHFAKDASKMQQLLSNELHFVFEDSDKNIWLGTSKGLNQIVSLQNNHFQSNAIITQKSINSYAYTQKKYWFGTANGELFSYDSKNKKTGQHTLSNYSINAILKSKKDSILFLTTASGELLTWDIATKSLIEKNKISPLPLFSIYEDRSNRLWIEPSKHGVYLFNPKTEKVHFFTQQTDATFLQLVHSYTIFEDNFNRVWIKLKGGGFGFYNPKTNTVDYFLNKPGTENQQFSNIVSCNYFDSNGILWLSTNDRGINKIIFQNPIFKQNFVQSNTNNKSENEIRALYTDKLNRLWVANKAGKLSVFDQNKTINNVFTNRSLTTIGLIYTITGDSKGNIWLGTKGNGLFKATPTDKQHSTYHVTQYKNIPNDAKSLSNDNIYSILEDKNGRIWIGTYGSGLNLVEEKDGNIQFIHEFKNYPLLESNRIRNLKNGYEGKIWVASSNGLLTFDPGNYNPNQIEFSRYTKVSKDKNSLGNNDVLFLFKDSEKKMWIGTAGGGLSLAYFSSKKQLQFDNFTKKNGLPNDFILSIIEDNDKNLWLATENGLSEFNLKTHKFRNYDSSDGLMKTGFSESTVIKLANGNLVFGGRNGYLTFNPKTVKNQKIAAKMVLTDFEINNKNSNVNSTDFPLKKDINYDDGVELKYNENTIGIYYTVLDYRTTTKQHYTYRLKGLDDEWHAVKNQKKATFTNLEPGTYEFEVKCLNTELYTNIPSKKITFIIKPPFWRTTWAYCFYALILLGLLALAQRIIFTMIKLRNNVIIEQKMTDLKLSFFTNISHELRTPLTLIVNPIDEIAKHEKLSPLGQNYIETVQKNASRLVRFVNQLLDFRKVQSGNEALHPENFDFVPFLNDLISLFAQISLEKSIQIKSEFSNKTMIVNLDKEKMDIVVYNLLSNAIKFSPDYSLITVKTDLKENSLLEVQVIDQGCGVEESKLDSIFNLYYESGNDATKNVGTGIGLALCKEYVNLHRGHISAHNNSFGGLTVAIEIDLKNMIFQSEINLVTTPKDRKKTDNTSFMTIETNSDIPIAINPDSTILLVEDNYELRQFTKNQLQNYYHVIEAENGKEGLKLAISKIPDLIISDVMMPEMDGISMLDALKNATETSHIPVILLTAKSSVESQIEGLKYGADYYITKPFSTDFLLASAENLIKSRKKFFEQLQQTPKTIVLEPNEIIITSKDEKFLKDIIDLVEKNLTNPEFNIDVIANSLNMSRPTFNRKFKSLTHLKPVEFVKEMRIKRAQQYLDAGETDIADIAYKVGFNGAAYFSTCFKEIMKITPTEYIKNRQ